MHRADAFTPLYSNTSARTGLTRACARDGQNRNINILEIDLFLALNLVI
jgi:hypothetical protein